MGLAMETICTFFLNYEQYIILLTICFFAGMAWRRHRLISRLFIIAASCLWVIYVYRYQIAVGWPALDASGELSLRELFSDGAFIRHWSYLLSAAAFGGALGVAFDDTPRRNFFAEDEIERKLDRMIEELRPTAIGYSVGRGNRPRED